MAFPALLHAQFQQPTPEELSMTADPKAPGASAVYLYREEIVDNSKLAYSLYERIKVLTEKGKELATVNIPYERGIDKVKHIEGRTIHADGTTVTLTAKPEDLMDVKAKGYQVNSVVFTLPSAEVGSILEYRLTIERNSLWRFEPEWNIQAPYFIHKAHYFFRPVNQRLMYESHLGPNDKVVVHGISKILIGTPDITYTLDIEDIPPESDEDWAPPLNTLRWSVRFFADTGAATGEEFWERKRSFWAGWIDNFIEPTDPLRAAAAGLVSPGDTDEQKAVKLYAAVQKLDNTDFSRTKSEAERKKEKLKDIHKAEDVWKQQSGSANDIALLYASMARAAGLKAWPAFVVNRNRAMFDISYLSDSQFDNDIVIVELGGKNVYLDPGQKMCPFGSLHWKHTWATGFRLTEKGAVFETTPGITYKESTVTRVATLDIDEAGNVKGSVRYVMTGPSALHWRQLALENDEDEVKKQFNESLRAYLPEGVQADFDHFLGLDDPDVSLIGIVKVSGNIGSATGKHFFLPGLFFESRAEHPFVAQDKRTIPIDVHYPQMVQDEVTYNLPPGFKVESLPQDANTSWPNHALLNIHSSAQAGSVTVSRTLAYNFTLLDPKDYPDLHDFYQKVATADQQQLVLTRAPSAKGN
ncbi:MAG: DUF3857 domain-containing protein [Terracidiphilus sp.]